MFSESCGCTDEFSDDFRDFRKTTHRNKERTDSNISMLNRLTARLAETETASELFDVLEEFVEEIGCEKFSLCLKEDWQEAYNVKLIDSDAEADAFNVFMTAPLIWENGERRNVEYFPANEMNPEKFKSGGNISYFLPLHFGERCLGYYIITNGDFPINSLLCHTLTMNISNSIENIRKLLHLNNAMDELNRLSVIDPLCNIYNRNGFINVADDMFKECAANHKSIMLSFIDMDGLKFINDNYGHNEGDFAIQRLASTISECCGKGSVCARFGGDEFVIFDTIVNDGSAETLARKFGAKIDSINSIIKKPYTLSASVGSIITVPEEGDTLYGIIKQADDKMYEIKKTKKNARKSEKIK